MLEGVLSIDGVRCAAGEGKISVFDRGFLFGDSAFEVTRTYGSRPFRLREHLARLNRSCEKLRIVNPMSLAAIEAEVTACIAQSGLDEAYVRVMVTRGVGPMGVAIDVPLEPSVLVFALPLKLPPPTSYGRGIAVALTRRGRSTDGTGAQGAKASNYQGSVLAVADARAQGASEAIIVGHDGQVIEGATSNLFVVDRGRVRTPPPNAGILEGITRRVVMELLADSGETVTEQALFPQDLYRACEVFITSSIRELMPVVRVDDLDVGDGRPGPVATELLRRYRQLTVAAPAPSQCRDGEP